MKQLTQWMILVGLLAGPCCTTGVAAEALLRDGFHIQAADGSLVLETDTGKWFFQFKHDLFDGKRTVPHERQYALLPTSVYERLMLDQQKRVTLDYRLWAQVTQYQETNYRYVTRFLPLRKAALRPVVKPTTAQPRSQPTQKNNPLNIPEAYERDHRTRPLVNPPIPEGANPSQPDGLMLDRVGYIRSQEDHSVFVLDGLGRTINPRQLTLLPNRLLNHLQQQQTSAGLKHMPFRVVGLITEHQGQEHLLLLRATRVYHYGNFGK